MRDLAGVRQSSLVMSERVSRSLLASKKFKCRAAECDMAPGIRLLRVLVHGMDTDQYRVNALKT